MDIFWKNRARHLNILVMFSSILLFGCQSTPSEEDDAELCQTESVEGCVDEDRGFNPCRINNNLPVCKK